MEIGHRWERSELYKQMLNTQYISLRLDCHYMWFYVKQKYFESFAVGGSALGKGVTRVGDLSVNRNMGKKQIQETAEEGNYGRWTGRRWGRSECDEVLQQKPVQALRDKLSCCLKEETEVYCCSLPWPEASGFNAWRRPRGHGDNVALNISLGTKGSTS